MAKSKKRIRKSIESYEKQIEIHEDKIKNYDGKDEVVPMYWAKEIKTLERNKKKEEKKLKKK